MWGRQDQLSFPTEGYVPLIAVLQYAYRHQRCKWSHPLNGGFTHKHHHRGKRILQRTIEILSYHFQTPPERITTRSQYLISELNDCPQAYFHLGSPWSGIPLCISCLRSCSYHKNLEDVNSSWWYLFMFEWAGRATHVSRAKAYAWRMLRVGAIWTTDKNTTKLKNT